MISSCGLKKSQYNSRVSLHEAPTKTCRGGVSIRCLIGQLQVVLVLVSAITDSVLGSPMGDFRGRQKSGSTATPIEQNKMVDSDVKNVLPLDDQKSKKYTNCQHGGPNETNEDQN